MLGFISAPCASRQQVTRSSDDNRIRARVLGFMVAYSRENRFGISIMVQGNAIDDGQCSRGELT
jgi:hypothetical protein